MVQHDFTGLDRLHLIYQCNLFYQKRTYPWTHCIWFSRMTFGLTKMPRPVPKKRGDHGCWAAFRFGACGHGASALGTGRRHPSSRSGQDHEDTVKSRRSRKRGRSLEWAVGSARPGDLAWVVFLLLDPFEQTSTFSACGGSKTRMEPFRLLSFMLAYCPMPSYFVQLAQFPTTLA